MVRKAVFALGFAGGYLLGTKAGRGRYDQIMRAARGVADSPAVQEAAGVVQAQAGELLAVARRAAGQRASGTVGSAAERAASTIGGRGAAGRSAMSGTNGSGRPRP